MTELNTNEEPQALPSKRKPQSETLDTAAADDSTKKLRPSSVEPETLTENGEKNEMEYEIEEDEDDYEEEEDETDSEDEDEHVNGEVDLKGKGIMKDDKGKGKMIEESDEDNDDSDDGGVSESDGDDDLSDDPLTEVDLDNILPSRTRRRTASSGVHISKDNDNDA